MVRVWNPIVWECERSAAVVPVSRQRIPAWIEDVLEMYPSSEARQKNVPWVCGVHSHQLHPAAPLSRRRGRGAHDVGGGRESTGELEPGPGIEVGIEVDDRERAVDGVQAFEDGEDDGVVPSEGEDARMLTPVEGEVGGEGGGRRGHGAVEQGGVGGRDLGEGERGVVRADGNVVAIDLDELSSGSITRR